ncbi:uncharacterized protein [Amphiura filiformis]|uniref:uncharacterized protein n=1 Tax=Amphiura filiformis TaxID=82378 RepID=UPI003B21CDD6
MAEDKRDRVVRENGNKKAITRITDDVCNPVSTEDNTGRYQWNYTLAGEYAYHPCPNGDWFDGDIQVYAYRPCYPPRQLKLLRDNRLSEDARWGEPTTKYCRFTSNVTNELQEIRQEIIDAIRDLIEDRFANLSTIILPLKRTNKLLSENVETLQTPDVEVTASILDVVIAAGVDDVLSLTLDFGNEIIKMVDTLLNIDFSILEMAGPACLSLGKNLQVFVAHADLQGADISIQLSGRNVVVDIQQETTGHFEGPIDLVFESPANKEGDHQDTVAKIHFPNLGDFLESLPSIRQDNNTTEPPQNSSSPSDRQRLEIEAIPVSTVRIGTIVYFTNKFFRINTVSTFKPSSNDVIVYIQVYKDGELVQHSESSYFYITYYHSMLGKESNNETNWFGEHCATGSLKRNDSLAWRSPFRTVELDWYPDSCQLNYTNENYTTCLCVGLEILALIVDLLPTPEPTTPPLPPDPLEFFSFPYSLTLSILSYVGYAFSLVSLILTILTYALFPRLRRGRQTYILLNMCVTLLMFVVFLLSSIAFCDTTMGCRVANIIRVYLILVSLMWNGVEGVHMYLNMVKVFSTYTSYFVVKSGIVAWGLPAIIIAIPLIIDVSIFDGSIVNCSFACQLSHSAFYFVFLLPMLVIVIFNSVVFGFVIKIIYNIHVNDGTKKSNLVNRVRGAIAILVLLGITWGFSAAAAMNYHYYFEVPEAASYVLQTLFVIGIAFQGFFIFAFHCVRYTDVRQQWRKILSPKTPIFARWRTRRKSIERPTRSQQSPQLTQEDLLSSPSPGVIPLVEASQISLHEEDEVGISFIDLRSHRNSTTEDTHL